MVALHFLLNIVLALLKLYPLGGARHCAVLFPAAALLPAAAAEALSRWAASRLALRLPREWIGRAGVALMTALALAASLSWTSRPGGVRALAPDEFLLKRADYERITEALWTKADPDDLIVMDYHTFPYFQAQNPTLPVEPVSENVLAVTLEHRQTRYQGFVYYHWDLFRPAQIEDLFRQIKDRLDYRGGRKIWFVQMGAVSPELFGPQLFPGAMTDQLLTDTAILVAYDSRVLYQ